MDTIVNIRDVHNGNSSGGMIDDFEVNDQFIIIFQLEADRNKFYLSPRLKQVPCSTDSTENCDSKSYIFSCE